MTANPRSRLRIGVLALAQIVAWGVLYYAVLVAAPAIAADTGWGEEAIFLAVTAGLLTSAICGIPVGRWLDRHPRRVMVNGAAAAVLALLAVSAAPSIGVFTAAWVLCGAAQAAVLYQAAFTVITHRNERARRGGLTVITLAGGLASTIFAPVTAWLVTEAGWRTAFLILAVILAVVVIPAYALTIESRWTHRAAVTVRDPATDGAARTVRFWALSVSLALMSFSMYAVTLSAVPASAEKGLDLQAASWVLGLIGVGQVLGRLLYLAVPHHAAPWIPPLVVGVLGSAALAGFAIAATPGWVFTTAVIAGVIRGALTLVQASAVHDRWGAAAYGRLNGMLAAPIAGVTALAPGVAATLAGALGSYERMDVLMASICLVGGLVAIRR
ncbi:MFS transporter [Microbacterium sp. B2969]|uniref:MFS transporter n=1 Tax=Microbacterium alkaliflavum TaxID=3248839 RepID=A0ABW7Q9H8_9MICO